MIFLYFAQSFRFTSQVQCSSLLAGLTCSLVHAWYITTCKQKSCARIFPGFLQQATHKTQDLVKTQIWKFSTKFFSKILFKIYNTGQFNWLIVYVLSCTVVLIQYKESNESLLHAMTAWIDCWISNCNNCCFYQTLSVSVQCLNLDHVKW